MSTEESEPGVAEPHPLFEVLRRFARTMTGHYDITDVLYELCDRVVEILGADGAGVSLYTEEGELRFVTATDENTVAVEKAQEALGAGPCFTAAEENRTVAVDDVRERDEWPEYAAKAVELGFRAVLGIPLVLNGDRIGALDVYRAEPGPWGEARISEGRVLADIAAAYLLNASELARTRRTAEQLQHALDSRVVIEQAKGRLSGDLSISVEEAFSRMRRHARSQNRTLREVAADVVARGAQALHGG